MLLERGPIEPIDVNAQFRASSLPSLASSASSVTSNLAGAQAVLGAQLSAMASDDSVPALDGINLDLANVNDELARQAGALDPSIGDVAAAAGDQGAQLPGLTNDVANDLTVQDPTAPDYVEHPGIGTPGAPGTVPDPELNPPGRDEPPPPGGGMYEYVASLYRGLLDREGSDGEIQGWVDTGLGAQAIRDAFIGSDEYRQKHGG